MLARATLLAEYASRSTVAGVVKTYDHPFDTASHEAIRADDIIFGVGRVMRAGPAARQAEPAQEAP